ncbi:MAG: UDP-N-acetylmuramate dehydrogenase [Verrucomicrobiales bacterium]
MNTLLTHHLVDELSAELASLLSPGTVLRKHEPMSRRTTLRVGGPADIYLEPVNESDLATVARFASDREIPFMVLGRGSNLLVRDGGIRGLVVSLAHPSFSEMTFDSETVTCGAGVRLRSLAFESKKRSITGFEFLEGIPGSIGGALRMNAGAMGRWIFERVEMVRHMDRNGVIQESNASDLKPEYRNCPSLRQNLALRARLKGAFGNPVEIEQNLSECSKKRWASQPAAPSAGCIFKNSLTVPAGKLVDELGLKTTRIGGAMVSDIHGNFIINDGSAKAADVLQLIELIKSVARDKRGIDLHTEVEIVGEDEPLL